jgi:hypothetical protein
MITFEHHGITVKCKPENAATYRAAMDKPPKAKTVAEKRDYPKFFQAGKTTTAEYLSRYAELNERLHLSAWDFDAKLKRAAPMLDPTEPEVLEEPDADWAPTATKKKMTSRAALVAIMAATTLEEAQNIAKAAL